MTFTRKTAERRPLPVLALVGLFALLMASATAMAAEITGVVKTSSGQPVAGATVSADGVETRTGPGGLFRLSLPDGEHALTARAPGLLPATRSVTVGPAPLALEIVLAAPPRRAEEVVVQAVRADPDTPVTKTDVNRQEIEKRNMGQEMPYLLKDLPSMTYYSDAGIGTGYAYVSLRGIGPTRINFTLDGAPLNEPEDSTLYFVDFGDFASSVESLQVQRGVGTSSAGVASFAGSVNFASLDLAESPGATARFSLGSFGTKRVTAGYQTGRLGDSGFKAYVRGSYQSTDGFRESSGINQRSVFTGLSHESEKGYFKLFGFLGRERSQSAYYAVEPQVLERDIRFNPMAPEEKDAFGQQFVEAQYTRFLGESTSLGAQLYVNDAGGWYRMWSDESRTTLDQYGLDWTNLGGALTFRTARGPLSLTWGVHGSSFESTHKRDVVGGGRDYLNHGFKSEASTFAKLGYSSGPWNLYADAQLRRARFRYEGSLDLGSVAWTFFNPKLGVRREVGKTLSLYASVGATSREPTRGDLLLGEDDATVHHDLTAVKPEKVTAFELGTAWKTGPLSAQLNLYDMEFRDEIALTGEQSAVGLALRRNAGRSFRRGLEWDLGWRARETLSVRFTGNWAWNRIRSWTQFFDVYGADGSWVDSTSRTFHDVQPVLSPPFVGNLTVEGSPLPSLSLGATARYVAKAYLDNTNGAALSTPGWWKVDLSAVVDLSRFVKAGRPRLRILVDNLLDEHRLYASGYSYDFANRDAAGRDTFTGTPYYFPLATRNVTAVLDLGF